MSQLDTTPVAPTSYQGLGNGDMYSAVSQAYSSLVPNKATTTTTPGGGGASGSANKPQALDSSGADSTGSFGGTTTGPTSGAPSSGGGFQDALGYLTLGLGAVPQAIHGVVTGYNDPNGPNHGKGLIGSLAGKFGQTLGRAGTPAPLSMQMADPFETIAADNVPSSPAAPVSGVGDAASQGAPVGVSNPDGPSPSSDSSAAPSTGDVSGVGDAFADGGLVMPPQGGQPMQQAPVGPPQGVGLQMPAGPQQPPQGMDPQMAHMKVQNALANPQVMAKVQQHIQQAIASGQINPQSLMMLGQLAQSSLQHPELWPKLREFALKVGLVHQRELPQQFSQRIAISMIAAAKAAQHGNRPGAYANGGMIHGPGTGTSDSIPAHNQDTGQPIKVSNNEYIIPADVVATKGREFFDNLVRKYHTPVAMQKRG